MQLTDIDKLRLKHVKWDKSKGRFVLDSVSFEWDFELHIIIEEIYNKGNKKNNE
jgi:hypothetical protein